MLYAGFLLLLWSKLHHCSHGLHLHFAENLVKDFVSKELHLVATFNFHLVHVLELGLALVELVKVRHLKSNTGMSLVNLYAQGVLDALDSQILAHRPKLLIDVAIVGLLLLPLLTD